MTHVPYFLPIRDTSDGTTPFDVELVTSEPDEMHVISRVVIANLTNSYTSLALLLGNAGGEGEIYYVQTPGSGERVVFNSNTIAVAPGMRLIARFVGLTSGDIYTISIIGILLNNIDVSDALIVFRGFLG